MRLFEVLLSLANSLAFLRLIVPRFRRLHRSDYIAPTALLVAIVQILVEGQRWQIVPAYVMTLAFFAIWLAGFARRGRMHINRTASILLRVFGTTMGTLVLLLSVTLPAAIPVFHFSKPTGPYAIGTVTYHWVDESRPELFTADPYDHRELMAQVWYPAKREPAAPRAPYIQDSDAVTPAFARLTHLPGFSFTHFKYVTTNAVESAPIADDSASYPVLIFLTGLYGSRSLSTFQVEELVSHGYVVVGLDQPGVAAMVQFPDGRRISGWPKEDIQPLVEQSVEPQPTALSLYETLLPNGIMPYFGQDVSFALDQLAIVNKSDPIHISAGHIDLNQAGAFGISLGGMTVAQSCLMDTRLKACLVMDVWMPADVVKAGLKQPTMFITRDANTMRLERQRSGGWTERDIALTLGTMRAVYNDLPNNGYYVQIPNMFHVNFTDLPYWSPLTTQAGLSGPISGRRGFEIVNAYSLAFFDRELKDQTSSLLNGPAKQFPEVSFETRQH